MEEQSRAVENPVPIPDDELHLLLGEQEDDVTTYRRREAAWISIAVHGVFILLLLFLPKWIPTGVVITPAREVSNPIFISSSEAPKIKPPKSNVVSDQDRRAQTPVPDKDTLRKLLDARRAGQPKPPTPPPQPQQAPPQQQQAQQAVQAPPQQGASAQPTPPPQATQQAQLQAPQPKQNPFSVGSASSSVEQAIHSAANNPRGTTTYGSSGDYGSGIHPRVDTRGNMEILSDTRGVDFGPYMKRLHVTVQEHWDPLIPEVALPPMMKKGMVVVEFAILKDGTIKAMSLVKSSGDTALDRAAWGALTSATPLPKLPVEFSGDYLLIRAAFFYNPDKHDFE
jgi:TonB family protein